MNKTSTGLAPLAAMLLALARCGSSDHRPDNPDDHPHFIPDINRTWKVAGSANHDFSFLSQQGTPNETPFTGSESGIMGGPYSLDGGFSGTDIQFTVHRSPDIRFKGKFLEENAIRVMGYPNEAYLLLRPP